MNKVFFLRSSSVTSQPDNPRLHSKLLIFSRVSSDNPRVFFFSVSLIGNREKHPNSPIRAPGNRDWFTDAGY